MIEQKEEEKTEEEKTETKEDVPEDDLKGCAGGMRWERFRQSYNVEDRRPGAPPLWKQRQEVYRANRRNGYPR